MEFCKHEFLTQSVSAQFLMSKNANKSSKTYGKLVVQIVYFLMASNDICHLLVIGMLR